MSNAPTATADELRCIPSLAELSDSDLAPLMENGATRSLNDGMTLFQEGDPVSGLFFLLDGSIRIHRPLPGGGRTELAVLPAGTIVGEVGLLTRKLRLSAASALGALRVFEVERKQLVEDYRAGERYALSLLLGVAVTLAQRLDASNQRVSNSEADNQPRGTDLESFKRTILEEWSL